MADAKVRDKIVSAASKLFAKKGYENTTIKDIAKLARIGKSTVFYYFQNKESILESIIEEAIGSVFGELQKIASSNIPPEEKFFKALSNHIHYLTKYMNSVKVFLYEFKFLSEEKRKLYISKRKHYELTFRNLIKELQEAGIFKNLDTRIVTMGILGMCNWMVVWYKKKSGNLSPQEISKVFYKMLLKKRAERLETIYHPKTLNGGSVS